jgi:hypothetical protein
MGVARPVEFTHFLGAQPYEVWGVSASLRREGALGVAEHPGHRCGSDDMMLTLC